MGALEFHVQRKHLPVVLGDAAQLLGELFLQAGVPGDAQQGGACAAEAEGRPGGAHQCLDLLVVGNQLFPVVLVELVLHAVSQELFVSQLQGFQHHGAVGYIVNRVSPVHLLRQHAAGQGGGQIELRHQGQELPAGMQGEIHGDGQAVIHHGGGEAAVKGGGQVVRVAFHGVGDVQQALGGEAAAPEHVGAHGAGDRKSTRLNSSHRL